MFWIASGSVYQQKHSILIETKPSSSSSFKVNRFHPGPWWTIKLFVQQRSVYNRVIKLCPFKTSSFVAKRRRSCAQFHWSRDPRPRTSDNCFHFLKVCEEKRHGDNGEWWNIFRQMIYLRRLLPAPLPCCWLLVICGTKFATFYTINIAKNWLCGGAAVAQKCLCYGMGTSGDPLSVNILHLGWQQNSSVWKCYLAIQGE